MKSALLTTAFLIVAFGASAAKPFTYGHAAFTYAPMQCTDNPCDVVPSCNRAHWSTDIAAFNSAGKENGKINIVYAYGGDIEFWANAKTPHGCWAPANNDLNVCNVSGFIRQLTISSQGGE